MSQEQDLQALNVALTAVNDGLVQLIAKLNSVPTDNPAIDDEIADAKAIAANMAQEVNDALNPPVA